MTDPITQIVILHASDDKSSKLVNHVKSLKSDLIRLINVNNLDTLYQLKHTQTNLEVTSLPVLIVRHKSGQSNLAGASLLPQLLKDI